MREEYRFTHALFMTGRLVTGCLAVGDLGKSGTEVGYVVIYGRRKMIDGVLECL